MVCRRSNNNNYDNIFYTFVYYWRKILPVYFTLLKFISLFLFIFKQRGREREKRQKTRYLSFSRFHIRFLQTLGLSQKLHLDLPHRDRFPRTGGIPRCPLSTSWMEKRMWEWLSWVQASQTKAEPAPWCPHLSFALIHCCTEHEC